MTFKLIVAYTLDDENSPEKINISKTLFAGKTKIMFHALLIEAPEIKNRESGLPDNPL